MDLELQKYYENRFSMMATQGWKDLVEDVTKIRDSVNHIGGIESEQQLWFKKGELRMIDWLINLKKTSEEVYDNIQQDAREDA